MSSDTHIYRIMFINQDKVYELYCRHIFQSDMYGFIEIEELVFGERSQVVVNPGEERLKNEFSGVKRSFIPMHAIIRVDEVEQEGEAQVRDNTLGNVTAFPLPYTRPSKKD